VCNGVERRRADAWRVWGEMVNGGVWSLERREIEWNDVMWRAVARAVV
jgi:hypothetical protein